MAKKKQSKPMNTLKRGNFWTINLGHIITLAAYLLTGAYYVGQTRSELTAIKTKISTIDQDITRIDREGSMYLRSFESTSQNHDKRLEKLEELIPKIAGMESKVNSIESNFSVLKDYILKNPK